VAKICEDLTADRIVVLEHLTACGQRSSARSSFAAALLNRRNYLTGLDVRLVVILASVPAAQLYVDRDFFSDSTIHSENSVGYSLSAAMAKHAQKG
jgi:hypothetical protein